MELRALAVLNLSKLAGTTGNLRNSDLIRFALPLAHHQTRSGRGVTRDSQTIIAKMQPNPKSKMQNDEFFRFVQTISQERLKAYSRNRSDKYIDVLSTYLWNIALSEALYPALHNFEIALRNSFHEAISRAYDNKDWLYEVNKITICEKTDEGKVLYVWNRELDKKIPYIGILHSGEMGEIHKIIAKSREEERPVSTYNLISRLHLGFWVSLTRHNYEEMCRKLFKDTDLFFPHLPKSLRTRQNLSSQFTSANKLRNKIFHHNPIWNHYDKTLKCDLKGEWDKILEAIEWISPMLCENTKRISRFPDIYDGGKGHTIYRELLQETMPDIIERPFNPPRLRDSCPPLPKPQRKNDLTGSS